MRAIIIVVLAGAGLILGISLYLAPDDMDNCGVRPDSRCSRVDAIVAISGGDTAARTGEAVRLYQNGWADTLILSGAALDKTGPSNAAAMREIAIEAGVPVEAIVIEEHSETTRQNAERTRNILEERDIKSVILVTSGYHQRRAGLEFQYRLGGNVEIVGHPVESDQQWSPLWWLAPGGWYLAVSELGKIVAFYLGGSR